MMKRPLRFLFLIFGVIAALFIFFKAEKSEILSRKYFASTEKQSDRTENKKIPLVIDQSKIEKNKPLFPSLNTQDGERYLKEYLKNGGDPNIIDGLGMPLFAYVVRMGDVGLVEEMIRSGADLKVISEQGKNLLFYSIDSSLREGDHIGVLRFLLEQGLDPNLQNNDGQSAVDLAVNMDQSTILELLIEFGGRLDRPNGQVTLLMQSVQGHANKVLPILIKRGTTVDAKDKLGRTALFYGVFAENIEAVKALVRANASVKHKDLHGKTIQDYAKESPNDDIASYLLER